MIPILRHILEQFREELIDIRETFVEPNQLETCETNRTINELIHDVQGYLSRNVPK